MGQYNTVSSLSGLFQEVYGDEIIDLLPESGRLAKMLPFVSKEKQEGNKYHQPVIVSTEQGFTYAAAQAGAFALNNHIASTLQDAQLEGSQIVLRSAIGYDAAAKASKGKKAFAEATELLVDNMLESMTKRLEICLLYGATGLGQTSSSSNVDTTHTVVTMATAKWASGIWAGSENAQINFYNGASIVSSGADSIFTITAVDLDARTISVSGTTTGISALDTSIAAGARDLFWFGSKTNEMSGLDSIATNTGSLFNIDASVYGLWKANSYSCSSSTLTMSKILSGVAKGVERGLNEKAELLISPKTYANVMSDLSALRKFDGSWDKNKGENGFQSVSFYSQNGEIEIMPYNMVKEGEAFLFPLKKMRRLGATEITFKTPGREDEIFLQLPSNAGFELRCYADQAIFCETPARVVKFTSIVNA